MKKQWLWMRFAVGEGLTKAASAPLEKMISLAGGTLGTAFLATLIIGAVQMTGGLALALARKHTIFPGWRLVGASSLFGVVAVIMTMAGFIAYTYEEAQVGVVTFIAVSSIVPGAFADWLFFGTRMVFRQWIGIAVFLGAGWAILGFPGVEILFAFPPWILIAGLIPLFATVNEILTRGIGLSPISSPFVNNFWIGLTTIILCATGLYIAGFADSIARAENRFIFGSVAVGGIVLGMITFKLLAYKAGGTIAAKKLIMMSTYLTLAVISGVLFYAEPFTVGKVLGIVGFSLSFLLISEDTWKMVRRLTHAA